MTEIIFSQEIWSISWISYYEFCEEDERSLLCHWTPGQKKNYYTDEKKEDEMGIPQ